MTPHTPAEIDTDKYTLGKKADQAQLAIISMLHVAIEIRNQHLDRIDAMAKEMEELRTESLKERPMSHEIIKGLHEEIEQLKKENSELRRENKSLHAECALRAVENQKLRSAIVSACEAIR